MDSYGILSAGLFLWFFYFSTFIRGECMKATQRNILAVALFSVFAMPIGAAPAQSILSSNTAYARIDELLVEGIAANLAPGAVVLVGHATDTTYLKAHGLRSVVPNTETMTTDTVFDIASLTKVVATTTAIMTLIEQGKVRLNDPVSTYIPGFEIHNKGKITVRHLLAHVSGLRPDVDLHPWSGYDAAIALAIAEVPTNAPEEKFVYSDINFFLLGDIVKRVSGETLDVYTKRVIFEPLGMKDTGFSPTPSMMSRMAPTERCAEQDAWPCKRPDVLPLRGVVHDPTARRMGGVAGHAGVFSTAKDLQRFAAMLVNGGELNGVRILAPATVKRMITPISLPANAGLRGLGWDIDTTFSSNRGDIFPIGSYGHTGFTGTSLWIDQTTQTYVIFLSSRLHPDGVGDVGKLRSRIATVAAAALSIPATVKAKASQK
jgi:CubicO group peptidase (beta-lactamase class C family)